jgi:hypothetical protein
MLFTRTFFAFTRAVVASVVLSGAVHVLAAEGQNLPTAVNLLANPDFEEGLSGAVPVGWKIGAHYGKRAPATAFVLTTDEFQAGKQSLKVISASGDFPVIIQSAPVPAAPNETYLVSAYFKAQGDLPLACRLFLLTPDGKNVVSENFFVRNQWQLFTAKIKMSDQQTSKELLARLDLMEAGAVYLDNIVVRRMLPNEDLSAWANDARGYRHRPTVGEKQVAITVGAPTGKVLPNIQGTCRSHPSFKELALSVIRIHNVLSSFSVVSKDEGGKLQYTWEKLDAAIDAVLATGAVPQMSLCFVPLEFVAAPDEKKIRRAYQTPYYLGAPTELALWDEYLGAVIQHCYEKYDPQNWYWIFGNEPSVAQFSMGTEEEFFALYQRAVKVATALAPNICFGAASFAHQNWLHRFIERCGKTATRLDVVSWHHYGILPEDYLVYIERTRRQLAQYPHLKNTRLAIDEWNPKLPDDKTPLSANEYGAASQAATIKYMIDGELAYHAFFIATGTGRRNDMVQPDGVKNPTWNVFKMLSLMGKQELTTTVPDAEPFVGAFATRDEVGGTSVLVWNSRHASDLNLPLTKEVTVNFADGVPAPENQAAVEVWLIDEKFSNGYNDAARQELEKTSAFTTAGGAVTLSLTANSVALIRWRP